MIIKGAPGWRRGARQRGAHKTIPIPGGGILLGHAQADGCWDVRQRIGSREGVVAVGTSPRPMRNACLDADREMRSIVSAARYRNRKENP